MRPLDHDWLTQVCAWCDPVFERADVGFTRQVMPKDGSLPITSILWEADPRKFAERYPDSGIVESYGSQWPDVHCIDYWVNLDHPERARVSIEGWDVPEVEIRLFGNGLDAGFLAAYFARILGVPPPADWLEVED